MKIIINGQILHQSNIFAVVLTMQILKVLSAVLNIYQSVYFFEYEHLKHFVWEYDNIFAYKRKIRNRAHFLNWRR